MFFYSLMLFAPLAMGQLVLGPCPRAPPSVQNLDFKRYSGGWHVVAQSRRHPLSASDCQRVTYSVKNDSLSANFSYVDSRMNRKISKHAVLKKDFRPPSGNMHLRFEDFPRSYDFRVLKTNYSDVAVEYTCLSGVFNYSAAVTVLHRRAPARLFDLNTVLRQFNVTAEIAPHFRKEMKLVNHERC